MALAKLTYVQYAKNSPVTSLIEDLSTGRIREDILKEKCAEALGLAEYDSSVFTAKVAAIAIPDEGILVFAFKDGSEQTLRWENRSRRESWTDEMKQAAREFALKGGSKNG